MSNKNNNKKELKLKKLFYFTIRVILILFIVIVILNLAVFSSYLVKTKGNIKKATIQMAEEVVGKQDVIFCLLLGISDDTNAILTDTIILLGYNPNSQKAFLISIPRDTYIGDNYKNANGNDKINSLYQKGPNKILEEVSNITGIKIENYVVVKTKVFREIIDSVGGLDFNVPIDMDYDDKSQNLHIHLKKGMQKLDGKNAEGLIRFRHNNDGTSYNIEYGDNDIGRMKTQRDFIKSLGDKIIAINDISKIQEIVNSIFSNLETNLQLSRILLYIPYGLEFNMDNLIATQLNGESELINNLWFYKLDSRNKEDILNLLKDLELTNEEMNIYYNFNN